MAYDNKYRTRVVEYVLEGHTQKEAASVFKIGTTSIKRWIAAYKETGCAGGGYQVNNRKPKRIDPDRLEAYMNEHPDAFLKEIALVFSCCKEAVRKALLLRGYTLKKRRGTSKNAVKKQGLPSPKR